ncbi:MAG: large conductance mechanosensitive channel protein MscL [Clostridia bacterium]|nr:large conductance mechanosensitive channel protein MscL [Clostridia bacterium]
MKKFFSEFKTFITRGNIVDMAVGVIVGGAFTAIVNGLSNFILKPIINYLLALMLGKNALTEVYTFLGDKAYLEDGTIDLANCFYIDWGAFINAIINFLIIALVLFVIVKFINKARENRDKLEQTIAKGKPTKEQRKELKAAGIKLNDKNAVKAYLDNKAEEEAAKKAAEDAVAAEKARLDRLANPTTEDLLKEILATLKNKA